MAKVIGLFQLRGTIDDVTFRKTKDGIIAGMKPGPSREKVLTHENFRRTRRNAGEFKLAIGEATLLRYALGEALNGRTGSSLNGRMYGLFCRAARQDRASDLGSRRASAGAIDLLRGFDFNKELLLEQALPVPLKHRLDVTTGACAVQVPAFIARKRKGFPEAATHFRILSGVVMVDFVHGQYRRAMQCSELLPLRKKTPEAIGFEHQLEPGEGKVMVQVLGMEFYTLVNGEEVLIKGSALRILEAVRMEKKDNETLRQQATEEDVCFDNSTCPALQDHLTLQGLPDGQKAVAGFGMTRKNETMRFIGLAGSLLIACMFFLPCVYAQKAVKHFIFFARDREGIHDSAFYRHPGIAGAQITYPWQSLEPSKGEYHFKDIEEDIAFLRLHGKKLFIQVQDVTFDSTRFNVPSYLLKDPVYNGGANAQYGLTPDGKPVKAGWVARRWDPAVATRFHLLLQQLARQFDGKIEGINLPETAVDFPEVEGLRPPGFTRVNYVAAIKQNMRVLKSSFKKSVPLLYANFMPGDSLSDSKADLEAIYQYARQLKLAMGGPDIKVYRPFQMANSYPLIRNMAGIAPTGVAVQEGNYSVINPKTGKAVTLPEIMDFATGYLKLSYIFWCTEEPYYRKEVLPMLRSLPLRNTP